MKTASLLSSLEPDHARDLGPYANPAFVGGANITDYSSITCDWTGNRMCMFGGGHGPSQETDIRIFDLNTLRWSSLFPPTPVSEMVRANCDVDNGRYITTNHPTARHSYNLTLVRGRRFYMMCYRGMPDHLDGWLGSNDGWGGRICWYDFDTAQWSYSRIAQAATPWYFAAAAVLDPISNKVLVAGPNSQAGQGGLWIYDPVTDAVATTGLSIDVGISPDFVYFPPTDRFYILQSDGRVWEGTFNRDSIRASTITALNVKGMPPASATGIVCGYAYDSVNRIIGGNVAKGLFYAFDPPKRSWSSKAMQLEAGSSGVPNQAYHCLEFDHASGCFVFLETPGYGATGAPRTWAYRYGRTPAVPASTVADLSLSMSFGDGNVATFSGANAVDQGDFIGEFVRQKCYLATNPSFPDWRVYFRVDADSNGQRIADPSTGWRDEVIVEYGRSTHGTPVHVTSPYVATINKNGVAKATYTVPKHWWYARWRYQSSQRPVVRTPAMLRARGWIPNFGTEGMYGGGATAVNVSWPGPMGTPDRPAPTYPFNPAMAVGGDHEEIGYLTEHAASYAIFGAPAALTTLRTEGEWCGNWCMHIRDDSTGAMPSFRDTTTFFKSATGTINDAPAGNPATEPNFVSIESSHWYPCANMPWLLTDDPYFLEELQFGVNWRILWNRAPRIMQKLGGMFFPGETRSFAWGLRDLFQLTASCPASVPSWLRPKSYWKACVDDNKVFAMRFVNSPARVHKVFRTWTRSDMDSAWMSAWLSTVVGIAIDQGFADWAPIFAWSIEKQIQMSNGTSGWNRQWPVPYGSTALKDPSLWATFVQYPYTDTTIDAVTCTSWADYWAYYCSGSGGHSDDSGHTIDPTGWDGRTLMAQFYDTQGGKYSFVGWSSYYLHLRSALAIAVTQGIAGAQACYSFLQGELSTTLPQHYRVTGQARFSIDPLKRSQRTHHVPKKEG